MVKSAFLLLSLACFASHCFANDASYEDKVKILGKIGVLKTEESLHTLRPPGGATNVTVNMYVRNILSICPKYRIFKVQLTFRQAWTDSRLVYEKPDAAEDLKYITYNDAAKKIWTPDLFFSDEVDSTEHELMSKNEFVRISPDGHVLYSRKITLELYCKADFSKPDFTCPMRIASYGYPLDELHVEWQHEDPIHVTENPDLPAYTFVGVTPETCSAKTSTGSYGCIRADFKFGQSVCHAGGH